jgi:protoporphyrinogen oxidase
VERTRVETGRDEVLVLGAGPAGLAAGWRLAERGRAFRVLEAAPFWGGCARTLRTGPFAWDSGPHRFHDRDPEATRRVTKLLAGDLREVNAPSRILWQGRFVDFPLRPLQALLGGGLGRSVRAVASLLANRIRRGASGTEEPADFASWAIAHFGRPVAESFLIPFSEKLWGLPAAELSPEIAGRRLPGFSFVALLREAVFGARRSAHLEGRFLYPRGGYGRIADAMAARAGAERIELGARVTGLLGEGDAIAAVRYERDGERLEATGQAVVSTLPVTALIRMLEPAPPADALGAAARLRFRDLVLVFIALDQESVSDAACTYFPDRDLEFTRIHEPRNRCREMSPPGKTSLVVEMPCFEGDAVFSREDADLARGVVERLAAFGLFDPARVEATEVVRLRRAYPVYARDYGRTLAPVLAHLERYRNLRSIGRGGSFFYGHVHDFVSEGTAAVDSLLAAAPAEVAT